MEQIDNIQQYNIYVDSELVAPGCWEFTYADGNKSFTPEFDFHVPLFLTRSHNLYEYVDVDADSEIFVIQRQEINPYYIELSFFDSIDKHKILTSSDLTIDMINFIRNKRVELTNVTNNEIKLWFDNIGVNELPWFAGTSNQVTADDIDKINTLINHTVSKADYFNIDIYK